MDTQYALGTPGGMCLLIIDGNAYVAGRQANAISVCTTPVPDELFAKTMAAGGYAQKEIGDWLLADDRVFILAQDDGKLSAIALTKQEAVAGLPGVGVAMARVMSQEETIASCDAAGVLLIQTMVLARQIFPAWASDKATNRLSHLTPHFIDLGSSVEA